MSAGHIKLGSRVAFSRKFCKSIGASTGTIPHARGMVRGIEPLGSVMLASVQWDKDADELPDRVNIKNLVNVQRMHLEVD